MFESHNVGVALSLFDYSGNVYLLHRIKDNLWALPGGRLEHGEEPARGLAREVHEEFGLCLDPMDLKPVTFSHGYHDGNPSSFIMLYFALTLATETCSTIYNAEPHKHDAIKSVYVHPNFGWNNQDVDKFWPTDFRAALQAKQTMF